MLSKESEFRIVKKMIYNTTVDLWAFRSVSILLILCCINAHPLAILGCVGSSLYIWHISLRFCIENKIYKQQLKRLLSGK
jgi:hypothetical protein